MSTLLSEHVQPITAPKLRDRVPSRVLGLVAATLHAWLSRRVARRELASLDARLLRDIGLDAGVVEYEASQWFWRPARDWRN